MSGVEEIRIERPAMCAGYPQLRAGVSTRMGGVSAGRFGLNLSYRVGDDPDHVTENRRRFFRAVGLPEACVAFPTQVHSAHVAHVLAPGAHDSCDALVTSRPEIALAVTVADCVPVLLFDPRTGSKGAVHAGWRGSAVAITRRTVDELHRLFDVEPADLIAFIGHAAGPCCYEVGPEVAGRFREEVRSVRDGRVYVDLKEENRRQLIEAGLRTDRVEVNGRCTICDNALHSHRRDGQKSGRMIAVIGNSL